MTLLLSISRGRKAPSPITHHEGGGTGFESLKLHADTIPDRLRDIAKLPGLYELLKLLVILIVETQSDELTHN